jgi:transposase-like protein
MGTPGPKKVHRYTSEFKVQAVRLSLSPEFQTQDVAHALDIQVLSSFRSSAAAEVRR